MTIQPATVAFRRIYMDISGEADAKLEALATAANKSKKQFVQDLINDAVTKQEKVDKKGKGK